MSEPEMPYGYDMMQDPDVVKEVMDNIAKLMKRNAELYAANERLVAQIETLNRVHTKRWVVGDGDAYF